MVKGFVKEDILIMASDGLTNKASKEQIFAEVKRDLNHSTMELVNIANENGGNDNITVVVIKNI